MVSTSVIHTTRISLLLSLMLMAGGMVYAQQDPMYNQYIFNAYTINPAEAGIRAYGTASFLQRWQWVGIPGAPATTSVGVETSYLDHWGFGLNVVSDKIGPDLNQTVNFSSGYHVALSPKYKLAAGMNVVINHRRFNPNSFVNLYDPDDPDLQSISTFRPNLGAGLLLYSDHSFLGISLPRLVEFRSRVGQTNLTLDQVRHLFLYGGRMTDISAKVRFKPSFLIKVVAGAPLQFDLNGVFSFARVLDAGFNYRLGDGLGLLAGITVKERFVFNYAYEIPLSAVMNNSRQTHEVGLRYRFGKAHVENVQSPRFFN